MAIPADGHGFSTHHRAHPSVLCASCGSRFDAGGATTGARVRCPLCAEVVELANVIAEKRRYRSRAPLTFGANGGPRRRRKRIVVPVALIALTLLVYFAFCLANPDLNPASLWHTFKHW